VKAWKRDVIGADPAGGYKLRLGHADVCVEDAFAGADR
jgi:hypothetical protein